MSLIFSLWLSINALASASTTDAQLILIAQTMSEHELREVLTVNSRIESLTDQCRLEIKLKRIPRACFAKIRLQKERQLISSKEHERLVRSFSSQCRQVARSSVKLESLKQALVSSTLSASCRKAVVMKVDDLDYQIGEVRELDRFLK